MSLIISSHEESEKAADLHSRNGQREHNSQDKPSSSWQAIRDRQFVTDYSWQNPWFSSFSCQFSRSLPYVLMHEYWQENDKSRIFCSRLTPSLISTEEVERQGCNGVTNQSWAHNSERAAWEPTIQTMESGYGWHHTPVSTASISEITGYEFTATPFFHYGSYY